MLISDKDIAAIGAGEASVIEQVSKSIYSKFLMFLREDVENNQSPFYESLRYENMRPAFLLLLVENIALAKQVQKSCHAILGNQQNAEVMAGLEEASRAANEMVVHCSVILSFDETNDLRVTLEGKHFDASFRRVKYPVFTMRSLDDKTQVLLPQLRLALDKAKFTSKATEIISVALARLATVCELFVQQIKALLLSKSEWRSYASTVYIFALIVELYARSFEYNYAYQAIRLRTAQ